MRRPQKKLYKGALISKRTKKGYISLYCYPKTQKCTQTNIFAILWL